MSKMLAWTTASVVACAALLAGCSPSGGDASALGSKALAQARVASQAVSAPAAVARGKIEMEGGLVELATAIDGTVHELLVKDGQSVQRGQLLLRLSDEASRADLSVAESEWRLAQARQKARQARLAPLKLTLTRWQTAAREGAADARSVDEAAQQLRDAQSEADVAAAEVKVAEARVEQLRVQRKRFELRAPEAGSVVRVRTHAGSQVATAQPVLTLLPNRPLLVRAELNESFAAAVREGMRATVVVDADSGSSTGAGTGAGVGAGALPEAKVLRISPMFGAARLQDDAQRGPSRVIECVLAFDTPPTNARVGQNVRVTFHE